MIFCDLSRKRQSLNANIFENRHFVITRNNLVITKQQGLEKIKKNRESRASKPKDVDFAKESTISPYLRL